MVVAHVQKYFTSEFHKIVHLKKKVIFSFTQKLLVNFTNHYKETAKSMFNLTWHIDVLNKL